LFVHGNPTWSFHWRRPIGALRDRARCVAIDHLGCGLSDKPQRAVRLAERIEHLGRLIDELALERVTLVAQDWGGAIGLGAMLARRDRLAGVVLFNTGAFPPWFIPRRIGVLHAPVLGRIALQGLNVFSRAAITQTLARQRKLPREVVAGYLAPYDSWANRRAVYEFVADIPRRASHPTWRTLESIEAGLPSLGDRPIRLVWGMRDWCFTPECLDRFVEHWPAAKVDRLEDVGHWVLEDAPDEALAAIGETLALTH
jgi:haloalkane dehalogenase